MHKSPLYDVITNVVKTVTATKPINADEISRDVLASMDLDRILAGGNLRTKDMTATERRERKARLSDEARRKRQERKKVERSERNEQHETRAKKVEDHQYKDGLVIVSPLLGSIDKTVNYYGAKFTNVIGRAHLHEVATKTLDDLAKLVMTDDKHDPDVYRAAALQVGTLPGVPDVPRGAPAGAARLAMMLKRRVKFNIIDWHRGNPTLESIEMLSTVAANMHLQVDNFLAKGAELNRNPYPVPDGPNMVLFRMIVDAAVENMAVNGEGIGWLLDLLMDENERDNVGLFRWRKHGEHILRTFSLPLLPDKDNVLNGVYAMKTCQKVFSSLPEVVRGALTICQDPRLLAAALDGAPHHSRLELVKTVPTFELSNKRKSVIIPEPGTTEQIKDVFEEMDTGLTRGQRAFAKVRDERVKKVVKMAAAIPTDLLVSELEYTFQMLLAAENDLAFS